MEVGDASDISFIEEIYSKNMKYFFYRRNFIEKVKILLLWKKYYCERLVFWICNAIIRKIRYLCAI